MIKLRCTLASPLAGTIRPPFGMAANAVMALGLGHIAQVDRAQLHVQRWRRSLNDGVLANSFCDGRIAKNGSAVHARSDLLEQLQPFCADAVFELGETGDVAAWPRQASNEAGTNWVRGLREYDGHAAGCLQQLRHHLAA